MTQPHTALTPEELQALIAKAQAGSIEARNAVVTRTLRYVGELATALARRTGRFDEISDMIQVGVAGLGDARNSGLIHAIATYDPAGGSWITWARWWVLDALQRYTESSLTVSQGAMHRAKRKHRAQVKAGVAPDNLPGAAPLTPLDGEGLIAGDGSDVYGITPVPVEPHAQEDDTAATIDDSHAMAALRAGLDNLRPHERYVMRALWGIDGPTRTVQDLTKILQLSSTRIRQLQATATAKLRTAVIAPKVRIKRAAA